jgi:hypothetical protein
MNNILDPNGEHNFLFLASVIAVLCEASPITVQLSDVERYWKGGIERLQYDMVADVGSKQGVITFSLKNKDGASEK